MPLPVDRPIPDRVARRALEAFVLDPETWCHISTYSTASHGYAQIGWWEDGHTVGTTAHRAAWVAYYGPIPPPLTVDHLCRNKRCVNPRHLRLLPNVENARDNGQGRKTHCPAEHPYDEANTYVDTRGHRRCRRCQRDRRAG